MPPRCRSSVSALAFLLFLVTPAGARVGPEDRPYSLALCTERLLHSKIVGIDFRLLISLPRDYQTGGRSYPLLITTDADYCFPLLHRMALFTADHDEMEPIVIVGLDYPGVSTEKYGPILKVSRTRDYTPTHTDGSSYGPAADRVSGGADRFLDFIEKELLPELRKSLRLKPDDVAQCGYSYGGLLASYALLTRPGLFRRSIVVSPSLWYDDRFLFRLLARRLPTLPDLPARIYWAIGSKENRASDKQMVTDMQDFVERLRQRSFRSFSAQVWISEGDTHHTVFPAAAMRGLRWIYSWSPVPGSGKHPRN